jgi:hypothetical protein
VRKPASPSEPSLVASLEPLTQRPEADLSLDEIMKQIERAEGPGPVLFILTVPVLLPLPPGMSMFMALPLLFVAPQIMIGRRKLWTPRWLGRREIKREALVKLVHRIRPSLEKLESLVHPRWSFLTGRTGTRLTGGVCTVIAVVLVLPIPFANLAPALAMSVFAMGLTRKDGLCVLAGYGLVILAAVIIALGVHGASLGFTHLRSLF